MSNSLGSISSGVVPLLLIGIVGIVAVFIIATIPLLKLIKNQKVKTVPEKEIPNKVLLEFKVKPYFLSRAENIFFLELRKITSKTGLIISTNVKLEDMFINPKNKDHTNLLGRKHVDFLIFDEKSQIKYAIELDGPSHQNEWQQKLDRQKNTVFEAAGLPLLRFQNGDIPTAQNIQAKLEQWRKQGKVQA
jgi:very-short-patch-repair endonuclease